MNDRVNVRERDYDMYLASLFIPNEYRARIWRLQSFYLELDRVSDQDLKFQNLKYSFWINNYKDLLNSTRVKRMVTSFQNKPQNLTTLKELEVEAEATVSQIFYLMLEILNIRDLKIDHGVSHLGQAIGIIKVLQNINGRIPSELLAKFKISSLDIHRKQEITKLQDLAFELGTRANDHLITSLLFQKEWPKKGFPVMLNYVTAKEYLKRLENCDFDLYKLQKNRSWNLPLKLLYYARRGILK
jgi:NADH dehydrogenase [ubiquinone] 1 alpha subcomplex assembly factor 6